TVTCDQEAGHPNDPLLLGHGTSFFKINAAAAIEACTTALSGDRDNPRYLFQYGRALDKKSDDAPGDGDTRAERTKVYNSEIEKGYAVAFNNLAVNKEGKAATEAEQEEASTLYLEYFNRTVSCCGRDVALYLLGRRDGSNADALGRSALELMAW